MTKGKAFKPREDTRGNSMPPWPPWPKPKDPSMTKKEMAQKIAEPFGIHPVLAQQAVPRVLDSIRETLGDEGRLERRHFGVFAVKRRRARKARNPGTGVRVSVPEKRVVLFKPGLEREQRVKELKGSSVRKKTVFEPIKWLSVSILLFT
jgi:integration host factor subunit beta